MTRTAEIELSGCSIRMSDDALVTLSCGLIHLAVKIWYGRSDREYRTVAQNPYARSMKIKPIAPDRVETVTRTGIITLFSFSPFRDTLPEAPRSIQPADQESANMIISIRESIAVSARYDTMPDSGARNDTEMRAGMIRILAIMIAAL